MIDLEMTLENKLSSYNKEFLFSMNYEQYYREDSTNVSIIKEISKDFISINASFYVKSSDTVEVVDRKIEEAINRIKNFIDKLDDE